MGKAEELKKTEATQKEEAPEKELTKALDENLQVMSDLIKADKGEKKDEGDLEEMMKDPKKRKKIQDLMATYGGEEDEDKPEAEEDEEEDEMKGKKSRVKKSFEDAVIENEEVIDAVPVLKSFSEVMDKMIDSIEMIKAKVESIGKAVEKSGNIQKSIAGVIETEVALIKSVDETVNKIGNQPKQVKGVINKKDILEKSFGDQGDETPDYNPALVKQVLLKGFQDGMIDASIISKWEMSRYNMNVLTPKELSFIKTSMGGK